LSFTNMPGNDTPRQAQTCGVCGGERYATYCRQCQHYDVWVNRYALTAWLGRTLLLTVVTGALGIGLNSLWEQRQRSRELILQQLDHAHEDAAALRKQTAELMGRRLAVLNCPPSTVKACFEMAVTERNSILKQTFALSWEAPHAFGSEKNAAARAADNSWMLASALHGDVRQNDYEYLRCKLDENTQQCEDVYKEEYRLRVLQNYCLLTLACMVAHREIELREDLIESGMHRRDRALVRILQGSDEADELTCTRVLDSRKSVCAGNYDNSEELLKDIKTAQEEEANE
jgi:hypothetical protein